MPSAELSVRADRPLRLNAGRGERPPGASANDGRRPDNSGTKPAPIRAGLRLREQKGEDDERTKYPRTPARDCLLRPTHWHGGPRRGFLDQADEERPGGAWGTPLHPAGVGGLGGG